MGSVQNEEKGGRFCDVEWRERVDKRSANERHCRAIESCEQLLGCVNSCRLVETECHSQSVRDVRRAVGHTRDSEML